jgi:hypothetical protein
MLAALPGLFCAHVCLAAPAGAWDEDLRRCMIYKPLNGGRVVIANDRRVLEIDVQRNGDANAETDKRTFLITFDNRTPIDTTAPQKVYAGIYIHTLGTYAAIAPVFAKARNMMIVITAPDKPVNAITVRIGNGSKAMAFLKNCDDYWRRYHHKHH